MLLVLVLALSLQTASVELSDDHRKWLERDVSYVITDAERQLFLSLDTDDQRARFIEAFWDHRDPDRLTPVNEYRDEHYRRLELAESRFGDSRTERSRYLVLLGEPSRIQPNIGRNDVVDNEVWFYEGAPLPGLPPRFNLVFFQELGVGDYQLYSPLRDRPEALVQLGQFLPNDTQGAIGILMTTSVELARASLTVDLTESVGDLMSVPRFTEATTTDLARNFDVRISMSSDEVLDRIETLPERTVDTSYIDGFNRFGTRVEADFSFNYVPQRAYWTVLYEPDGAPYVHYAIELDPADVTLKESDDGGTYYTTFEIELDVRARGVDAPIVIPAREAYVEVPSRDLDTVRAHPFAFQDSFALIPGAYRVAVTLRNLADQHFTIVERNLSVGEAAELGGIGVGYGLSQPSRGSFTSGGQQFFPPGDALFAAGSEVHAVIQTFGLEQGASVQVALDGPAGTVVSRTVETPEPTVVEAFDLTGVPSGPYSIRVDVLGTDGGVRTSRSAAFDVLPPDVSVRRPALLYRTLVDAPSPERTAVTLSEQYLSRRNLGGAELALRRALETGSPEIRWRLASVVLFTGRAQEALELLEPLEADYPNQIEVIEGLGFAHYLLGNYGEALPRFELAMAMRPPDTSLLNAAGDSFEQLGRPDKARELFELSLQANPNQPGVQERLANLQ